MKKRLMTKALRPMQATMVQLDWLAERGITHFSFGYFDKGAGRAGAQQGMMRDVARVAFDQRRRAFLYHRHADDGLDIYLFLASPEKHRILILDDLDAAAVIRLASDPIGQDIFVLETSEANYQVLVACPRALTREDRKRMELALAEKLGADRQAATGCHSCRLAGFNNKKRGRNNDLVRIAEPRLFVSKTRKSELSDSERVRKALENLHPDAISRDEWVQICGALQSLPDGQDIWHDWNNRSDYSDVEKSKVSVWKSFHGSSRGLTLGTIFYLVSQYGTGCQT